MNDITDTQRANGASYAPKKEDAAMTPPDSAEFERFADLMTRDLRRAQTQEFTGAAKAHFHPDNPDAGSPGHDQAANDMLEELNKKHTHEQIMFRTSIGKLRSFYSKAREQQAGQDRSRPQFGGAEKSSDFERSM